MYEMNAERKLKKTVLKETNRSCMWEVPDATHTKSW